MGGYLMGWIYELNIQLLIGDAGMQIVGWSGVALLVLLVTGVIAWWPRGSWVKALAFKRQAASIRRLHDLHKLTGLGSAGLLTVLTATGVILALPSVKMALLAPMAVPEPTASRAIGPLISVEGALRVAQRAVPNSELVFIDVLGDTRQPYRFRLKVPGDPHRRFPGSYVFIDRRVAEVVAIQDVRRGGFGDIVNAWVRPVQDGSVGGLPIRILAVLVRLAPSILTVTGLLRWHRRRGHYQPRN